MTDFKEYIALRLGYTVITLFFVSVTVFLVTQVLPGNAADTILGRYATPQRIANVEAQLGINKPLYLQYFDWISGFLTGNWGESYIYKQQITTLVWPRFVHSFYLAIITLPIIALVGIPLGVGAAVKRDTPVDLLISFATYIGISIPSFVTGTLLILVLGGPVLSIFPSGGYVSLNEGVVPWISHMILPIIALTLGGTAHVMRQTRSEMVKTLQTDYVRTATVKGLPRIWVVVKHALRNGLLPTVTVLGLQFGWLMGSLVVVEEIFAYPGIGRLVVNAVRQRDIPVLQISVLIIASSYALANFAADIIYTKLDPQIEYGES